MTRRAHAGAPARTTRSVRNALAAMLAALIAGSGAGCSEEGGSAGPIEQKELVCDLDLSLLADGGVGRDGIPALSDPEFVPIAPQNEKNSYIADHHRVIALFEGGEWLVIPHNIMWRHEIVNLPEITVTYCPLTGSALAFARLSVGGAEFGVSGLLYQANLMLYDRNEPNESLWSQMLGEARCGPRRGQSLQHVPVVEMEYGTWRALHPDSKIVALPSVFDPALYFFSPYGFDYEKPENGDYLGYPIPQTDKRLLPKARILGIPDVDGRPVAYSFRAMAEAGDHAVFELEVDGEPAVVLWSTEGQAAMVYRSKVNGTETTFRVTERGIEDDLTGSVWLADGTPVDGPLAGTPSRLRGIPSAYVAFWGAWAAFHPNTELAITP